MLLDFLNSDIHKVTFNPIIPHLPVSKEWATPPEIDSLHVELASQLNIMDVHKVLKWKFNKRFTAVYGQAEFEASDGSKIWQIQYATRYWLLLAGAERKNLITHEMCHLAVERHFGYDTLVNSKKVLSHGCQWKKFMDLCKEDPQMIYKERPGLISYGEIDYKKMLEMLNSIQNEPRTSKNSSQSK